MRWLELGERGVRGSREVFAGVALEGEGRRHDLFREDAVSGVFLEVLGVHGVGHVLELVDELVSFRVPETQLVQFLVTLAATCSASFSRLFTLTSVPR